MTQAAVQSAAATLDPRKFQDPATTLDGSPRASVALRRLQTLWFNTGTLWSLTSPKSPATAC